MARIAFAVIAARPNLLRRDTDRGGDQALQGRPGLAQSFACRRWMIAIRDGQPGETLAPFFQGCQYICGMPIRGGKRIILMSSA